MFPSSACRSPKLPGAWIDSIDRRMYRVSSLARPYSDVIQSADHDARSHALPRPDLEIVPRVSALLFTLSRCTVHAVLLPLNVSTRL